MPANEDLLTPKQLANLLKGAVSVKTLANWRADPTEPGPPYHRLGNKILYPKAHVEAWLENRLHRSTLAYKAQGSARARRRQAEERAALEQKRQLLERELMELNAQLGDLESGHLPDTSMAPVVKRPRGRPRKVASPQIATKISPHRMAGQSQAADENAPKRPRGRPRKPR